MNRPEYARQMNRLEYARQMNRLEYARQMNRPESAGQINHRNRGKGALAMMILASTIATIPSSKEKTKKTLPHYPRTSFNENHPFRSHCRELQCLCSNIRRDCSEWLSVVGICAIQRFLNV
jgi:hypothetical protein